MISNSILQSETDHKAFGRQRERKSPNFAADLQQSVQVKARSLPKGTDPVPRSWGRQRREVPNYNEKIRYPVNFVKLVPPPEFPAQTPLLKTDAESKQWLADAGEQLEECVICAEEDELPVPSEIAMTKSRELLQQFSGQIESQPDIYPMDESGIAIDFRTQDGRSGVLFVVDQDGSGAMFFCAADMRGRLRVDEATLLPKEGALRTLRRVGIT